MAANVRILYHWTHRDNVESIRRFGLDPAYSTGELWAIWGCTKDRIEWARQHVASKHNWHPDDLVLLRVEVYAYRTYRTCWEAVYYTPQHIRPTDITFPGPDDPTVGTKVSPPIRPAPTAA